MVKLKEMALRLVAFVAVLSCMAGSALAQSTNATDAVTLLSDATSIYNSAKVLIVAVVTFVTIIGWVIYLMSKARKGR